KAHDRDDIAFVTERYFVCIEDRRYRIGGPAADHERVTVAARSHYLVDCEYSIRARLVLNHERLSETVLELFRENARDNVGGAAGRERHDDLDRPARIILRPGKT